MSLFSKPSEAVARARRHRRLGRAGERAAERWLRARGFRTLARNWRRGRPELDLVGLEDGVLVFVEVKTAAATSVWSAHGRVGPRKLRALRGACRAWRAAAGMGEWPQRVDEVVVDLRVSPWWRGGPRAVRVERRRDILDLG